MSATPARSSADAGLIVPVRDPPALAAALATLAKEPATVRAERGKRARARIVENFAMARAVARFAGLYASLPADNGSP